MIDAPRYEVIGGSLNGAWGKLKKFIASIKPDENYKCNTCELADICKWCPAKAWLYNKTFTFCDPESRSWAEKIKLKE
jgi:radical SAM protein with 4Fe4S-binding SPASM domain